MVLTEKIAEVVLHWYTTYYNLRNIPGLRKYLEQPDAKICSSWSVPRA